MSNNRDTHIRAKRLQALCSELSLTSMVFILGIDSHKNRTTEKLFHWLFFGQSGNDHISGLSLSLDHEEVTWVVTSEQVFVFLGCACGMSKDTALMHEQLIEACIAWDGVVLEHLPETEFEDSEAAENTKMLWFTQVMRQLEGPTGLCGYEIETWPLIQAYALDLFGLGFFSMKHPPIDISTRVEALFHEFDDCLLEGMRQEQVPRLLRSLDQTREAMHKRTYVRGRGELTASTLSEFLTIPYEYALLQTEKTLPSAPEARFYPEVEGKMHASTHVTLRAVCGETSLICSRTWFFLPHKALRDLVSKAAGLELLPLIEYYRTVAGSLRAVLPGLRSEEEALERFQHKLLQHHVFKEHPWFLDSARYHVSMVLRSIDADGNPNPYSPDRLKIHTIEVRISEVHNEAGSLLGDLLFGESFSTGNPFLVLTDAAEVMGLWDKREESGWAVDHGQRLFTYENFLLVFDDLELMGSMWIYQSALVFTSLACGRMDVLYQDIKELVSYSGNYLTITEEACRYTFKVNTACLNTLESLISRPISHMDSAFRESVVSPESPVIDHPSVSEPISHRPELIVITGVAGSGKTVLAEQLCKQFSVPCIKPQLHEQAYFNEHYYAQTLSALQAPLVVVVLPGYTPAARIMGMGQVSSVIVKLHSALILTPEKHAWQPNLRELIKEANAAILEEHTEVPQAFLRQIKRVNPDLSVYHVKALPSSSLLRAVWEIRKPLRLVKIPPPIVRLESAFFHCAIPLKKAKLEENIRGLQGRENTELETRVAAERQISIWHLKGTLLLSGAGKSSFSAFKVSGPPSDLLFHPSPEDGLGLLVIGLHLDDSQICSALLNSRSLAEKVPLRTKESLTPEELDMLSQGLETPEGYLFDGYSYINADGEKTKKHPMLEARIVDFVEQENERIGEFNRKLQKESSNVQRSNHDIRVYSIFE